MARIIHLVFAVIVVTRTCLATEAGTTTITIGNSQPGVTPFIATLRVNVSPPDTLNNIKFTVTPKPGSVTRPLSAVYTVSYLVKRGYFDTQTGALTLPIFGLYANYVNSVNLRFMFDDGSSQDTIVPIATASYSDPCGFTTPTVVKARTQDTSLSYDYILVKGKCLNTPKIIDTDGELRWVGFTFYSGAHSIFLQNGIYVAHASSLSRLELDGGIHDFPQDYGKLTGIGGFHHNIDVGRNGIILDGSTLTYYLAANIEVDPATGNVFRTWNFADIISAAMVAGGDDPTQFIAAKNINWWHNNSVTYRRSDNTLIVSSRENFVMAVDYDSGAIKWILGDHTRKWYTFRSLKKYALNLNTGSIAPDGQHSVGITYDDNLLVFDNGTDSDYELPQGPDRPYSAPRKYHLDLTSNVATEVWNYPRYHQDKCRYCGSTYEDAPLNYLVDLASNHPNQQSVAEIYGINSSGKVVFDYAYPNPDVDCFQAWNSNPIHLEHLFFDR